VLSIGLMSNRRSPKAARGEVRRLQYARGAYERGRRMREGEPSRGKDRNAGRRKNFRRNFMFTHLRDPLARARSPLARRRTCDTGNARGGKERRVVEKSVSRQKKREYTTFGEQETQAAAWVVWILFPRKDKGVAVRREGRYWRKGPSKSLLKRLRRRGTR